MFCRSHRHLLHTHTSLPGTLILPPLFLDTCLIYQSFSSYSRLSRLSPFPEGSGRGWRGAVSQLYCAPGLPLAILEGWPGTRMLTALGCWPQHPGSLWRRFPVFVEVHSPVTFLWGSEHQSLRDCTAGASPRKEALQDLEFSPWITSLSVHCSCWRAGLQEVVT